MKTVRWNHIISICVLGLFIYIGRMNVRAVNGKEITAVQFNYMKISTERFGEARVERLRKDIESLLKENPIEEQGKWAVEDYETLCLHYEDQSSELYCFYQPYKNSGWQMMVLFMRMQILF